MAHFREFEGVSVRSDANRHPQDGPHVDLRFRVEPGEFVVECSMNLVFLDWMLSAPREDEERVAESELRALKPRLEAYFSAQAPVGIDGVRVEGVVRDLQANDPDEVLLPLFPLSGWKGLRKISFEVAYPLKSPPSSISVVWPAYPPDLLSVLPTKPPLDIAAEWTAEGLRSQVLLTRTEPGFTWHRPGGGIEARLEKVPAPPPPRPLVPPFATMALGLFAIAFVSAAIARRPPLVALGTGLLAAAVVLVIRPQGPASLGFGTRAPVELPAEEAVATFDALLANLYRAFDYEEEGTIYDALSRSVSGGLLEETYLGVRRALVMEEEGGAMSRVVAVRPVSARVASQGEIEEPPAEGRPARTLRAFVVEAVWRVDGRVTHWGHAHDRTNEYEGRFVVAAEPEGWRIHDSEIVRQERIDSPAAPADALPTMPGPDDEL